MSSVDDLDATQVSRIKSLLQEDIELYKLMRKRFEDYFCNAYTLANYSDHKVKCVVGDEQICQYILSGGSEYIPSNIFADSKAMETLKAEIGIQN